MVKVSVVIPAYNVQDYIADTLNSVLSQTLTDYEIIVVDDSSSDNTIAVVNTFDDSRIRVVKGPGKGVSWARNLGVNLAQGMYIAFLDADDMWYPTKLEAHIKHLESKPGLGLSFSSSELINEDGSPTGLYQIPSKFTSLTPEYLLCRCPVGNGSSPVLRKDVAAVVSFDTTLAHCEDLDCWVRIMEYGWGVEGIKEVLTKYRVRRNSASSNLDRQVKSMQEVLLKHPNLASYHRLALAYQLRFVSRRAIKDGEGKLAIRYINQALMLDSSIIWREPNKTLITLLAAYTGAWVSNELRVRLIELLTPKLIGAKS